MEALGKLVFQRPLPHFLKSRPTDAFRDILILLNISLPTAEFRAGASVYDCRKKGWVREVRLCFG